MEKFKEFLKMAKRFRPLRTFAQALAASLAAAGVGLLEADWVPILSMAGMTGLATFLYILAEGGEMFAPEKEVGTEAEAEVEE